MIVHYVVANSDIANHGWDLRWMLVGAVAGALSAVVAMIVCAFTESDWCELLQGDDDKS